MNTNTLKKQQNIATHFYLLLATFGWATMYIFIKYVAPEVDPLNISFARYLFASLFFIPFVFHKIKRLEKKDILPIVFFSLLNASVATMLNVWATTLSTASNAAIIINSNPLMIIMLAPFLIGEKNTLRIKIGGIIGFIGLYLTVFQGFKIQSLLQSEYVFGNLVALFSASIIAVSTIYLKKYLQKYGAITITFVTFVSSLILLLGVTICNNTIQHFPTDIRLLLPLIGFGTISTIIPFLAFNHGIQKIGASKASIYKLFIPVVTAILAWLLLSEKLTVPTLIGMTLIGIGIYLVNKKKVC
jgi:drug/metabolite transporter (DMT)-like permease